MTTAPSLAFSYASAISFAFVASLYVLVPKNVRALSRDQAKQIKWRTFASGIVCIGSFVAKRILFDSDAPLQELDVIGSVRRCLLSVVGLAIHTVVLYSGPITSNLLRSYLLLLSPEVKASLPLVFKKLKQIHIDAYINHVFYPRSDDERWTTLRNIVVAPLFEEVVFRDCILTALAAAGIPTLQAVLIGPLFFGFAHLHHAILHLSQGYSLLTVCLQTLFQFSYTSLFGAYASYAYLKTRSILAVTVSHSICNAMGLPAPDYTSPTSPLYPYRRLLHASYLLGVLGFIYGLTLM